MIDSPGWSLLFRSQVEPEESKSAESCHAFSSFQSDCMLCHKETQQELNMTYTTVEEEERVEVRWKSEPMTQKIKNLGWSCEVGVYLTLHCVFFYFEVKGLRCIAKKRCAFSLSATVQGISFAYSWINLHFSSGKHHQNQYYDCVCNIIWVCLYACFFVLSVEWVTPEAV